MTRHLVLAAASLTPGTFGAIVAGALAAGVGVTLAFCGLLFCLDRRAELRRAGRLVASRVLAVGSGLFLGICLGLVAFGLLLVTSKPK
jgi:hypothetical protein